MTNKECALMFVCIAAVAVLFAWGGYSSAKSKFCNADHLCPNTLNALNHLRDYQIELHNDTVWIYDGDRKIGQYISNWKNQMDTMLLNDNQ